MTISASVLSPARLPHQAHQGRRHRRSAFRCNCISVANGTRKARRHDIRRQTGKVTTPHMTQYDGHSCEGKTMRLNMRQHRGQKYAVVARVRLAADHGNVEAVGSPRNELLDRSHFPPFRCRRPPTAVVASGLMLMLTRALWQGSTSCAGSTTT